IESKSKTIETIQTPDHKRELKFNSSLVKETTREVFEVALVKSDFIKTLSEYLLSILLLIIHEENDSNDDNHPDNLDEMLHDAEINVDEKNVKKLQQLFVEAEKALYNGCKKFTKLSFVLKLLDLKAKNNWSDKSFTTLLELLHEAFPEDNELPVSTYQAKKLTCPMGLEVQRIHACPNDCILYRKAYKDLHECPVCKEIEVQA
ncbi:hypothetical protein Tco_1374951, partial [Tanacetum coccineum]